MEKFPPKVIEQLKYYVYLYIDPRTDKPFYIGKGNRNRVFDHLNDKKDSQKTKIMAELRKAQLQPRIEILKYGLTSKEAHLVEATAIDLIDIKNLSNKSRGHGSRTCARASVEDIYLTLNADPIDVKHDLMLININKAFRYGMSHIELYDATRCAWAVGVRRETVEYALCVYQGVVREVYKVSAWVPAGHSMRSFDAEGRPPIPDERWEFVGVVAEESICKLYRNKSVKDYYAQGAQNPIRYATPETAK
ncbi:MAG: hypothetical protein ACF8OB_02310 [Phycisphaeraceae bacterium JB051]